MFELVDAYSQNAVIKVIGVGGGGSNAPRYAAVSEAQIARALAQSAGGWNVGASSSC